MIPAPKPPRPGEVTLGFDPAERADAAISFIGHIRSSWGPEDCPKNIGRARERGVGAEAVLREGYAAALTGLEPGMHVVLIYWMHGARRDLAVQRPRHAEGPRGTFALRSPARPNPLALSTVRLTAVDHAGGILGLDAIDCYDGTPLVDIKPWLGTVDLPSRD